MKNNHIPKSKILFMLLPFWTPLIPPLGIASLKSYISKLGYDIKTVDANVNPLLWETYTSYFDTVKALIPGDKVGNFYNTGNDVLKNHLMACLNFDDEDNYSNLVKALIYKNYYTEVKKVGILELNKIVNNFYTNLRTYLLELLESEKPTIVGMSVYSGTLAPSLFAFKLIKEVKPKIMTIMGGGVFADQLKVDSPNYYRFLERNSSIDKIIIGEGEILLQKLLEEKLPEKRVYTLKDINNDTYDLMNAETPDFSDFNIAAYPYFTTYVSRSCPYQCNFCSETVQWGRYRKKPAKKIVAEMQRLYREYKRQLFLLGDSLLNPIISELAEEFIKSGISLYWDGYLRAEDEAANPDNTILWRKGGYYRARIGAESGSDRVLGLMNKKITSNKIKAALQSLAMAGIKTTTYWVIGYPGETEEDFRKTLDILEEMQDDIYEAECNPFNYFLDGQVGSDKWKKEEKVYLLYPEDQEDSLVTQTWVLDTNPSRQVTYERVIRFVKHCRKLGIPNPYSIHEIHEADERWIRLQRNAVPPMINFSKDLYLSENYHVNKLLSATTKIIDETNFGI